MTDIAAKRIRQVFEFLKHLNSQRSPSIRQVHEHPWHLWLDELPAHPSIVFPRRIKSTSNSADSEPLSPDILCVRRPTLTPPPAPPEVVRGWLLPGWEDPKKDVELLHSRNETTPEGSVTVRWSDDHGLQLALDHWLEARGAWKAAETPARNAIRIFDRLYALHGRQLREAERFDLVIGDGILSWKRDNGSIFHPVLLQCVQLVFDAQNAEFRIVDSDRQSEFHLGLFQSEGDVDPLLVRALKTDFENGCFHPLDLETDGMLKSLVNLLSSQGSFEGSNRPEGASEHPRIGRAPVLYLRSRMRGFGPAIDTVLGSLGFRKDFCPALKSLVGCESTILETYDGDEDSHAVRPETPTADILFGKQANHDQLRIARAVDRHGSVLVQGPPGTGKSHTIANLIGHLLAQGQTILVTSHTTKALRVLRSHVVEELRPLCVSLLDNDLDSREQLEQSIRSMSSRLTQSDLDQLDREAKRLEHRRALLIKESENLLDALHRARADEYRDIVVGGKPFDPSSAARLVADAGANSGWIPGPVAHGEPCPLSPIEAAELYSLAANTSPLDDDLADSPLPDVDSLPTPEQLASILREPTGSQSQPVPNLRLWPKGLPKVEDLNTIRSLIEGLSELAGQFAGFGDWQLAAIESGRHCSTDDHPWALLVRQIHAVHRRTTEIGTDLARYSPQIAADISLKHQRAVANEITCHLQKHKSLGWATCLFRPAWKKMIARWRIRGNAPSTADHFRAIQAFLTLQLARSRLRVLWNDLMASNGYKNFAELGANFESVAFQLSPTIEDAIKWWTAEVNPRIEQVKAIGFDWNRVLRDRQPIIDRFGEIKNIISAVKQVLVSELSHAATALESEEQRRYIEKVARTLDGLERIESSEIRLALETRDIDRYRKAMLQCKAAEQRRRQSLRLRELLARLERHAGETPVAHAWAFAIRTRDGRHCGPKVPGDVGRAWEYRQLAEELQRRASVDTNLLGKQARTVQDEIHEVTNQLIELKAWASQVRRTTSKQRQALTGWLGMIKKVGKGTGKRAPELRRAAQQQMEECRSAVPVWIMPLSRIAENFDFSEARFDVVIIDEASQCDVMGYLAFIIGRRIVVVGDDKQVSPSAVGQEVEIASKLIKYYLDGVPNAPLYDGKTSIYELAHTTLPSIMLHEHFRCVSEIIQFSNHLSYNGEIRPLREDSSCPLSQHVVNYRVEGVARRDGKVNEEEALAISSLIVAATEHPAYFEQTIGVISLLGDDQAKRIESILRRRLSLEKHEKHRVICGNSAQFQGDERAVMFLSMIDSPSSGPLRMKNDADSQKRYNVAASRARNQMWIVHSLNCDSDLKPGDLRRRLIEHAMDPGAITRELFGANETLESRFERDVYERLVRSNYSVRSQWAVGSYRIDLVVQGSGRRVAIECDGDRYHPVDKIPEDMARQAVLERLGWRFIRIRGSVFYRDPEGEMARVFLALQEMGIEPQARVLQTEDHLVDSSVVAEVIRAAAQLRAEWVRTDLEVVDNEAPDEE